MKRLIIVAFAFVFCVGAVHAQGQVNFGNKVSASSINAIVKDFTGTALSGPTFNAALYVREDPYWILVPGSTIPFRTGAAAGYISSSVVTIPGHPDKSSVSLIMAAFDGPTYNGAQIFRSYSDPVTVTLGGGLDIPPDMVGLTSFDIFDGGPLGPPVNSPEPSTVALGLLGAAGLFILRRK